MTNEQMVQQFQRKVIQHGALTIIPVEKGICDIFEGPEWNNHSRYQKRAGKWYYLSGRRINAEQLPS